MFSVNDEPEGKFLYTETIKVYYTVLSTSEAKYVTNWITA